MDSFSTDGGCYPRNVIVENGLLLVKFGALNLNEYAVKASLNGARALGLKNKGHLSVGSLAACQEHFALYWGQKLVNTLRALHDVKYNQPDEEEENEEVEEDE